jgi:hypothetical protein
LADALQVSAANLEGQPADPGTPELTRAAAAMPAVRAALVAASLGDDTAPGRSAGDLAAEVGRAVGLRTAANYAELTPVLPDLITDLHGLSRSPDERVARSGLRLLVPALFCCTFTVKYLGYPDLAMMAAEQGQRAAERLDEPALRGIADFARVQSLPPELKRLSWRLADDATGRLVRHAADPDAGRVYGMLHLVCAYVAAVDRRTDDVGAHLAEAVEVAARLGEADDGGPAGTWFGPTNVAFWRAAIAVELGEGGRVRDIAPGVRPEVVRSATRRAAWYIDVGRGLAQTRRDDREAVAYFTRAERVAPQRVRVNASVRDTVSAMLRRARNATVAGELRELAHRVGVV